MTPAVLAAIRRARESGDLAGFASAIPYSKWMGITAELHEGRVRGVMHYAAHLTGNPVVGALHGGTLGALLESTAIFALLWESETVALPKTINITVEYLRSGRLRDTYARADVTRQGRRVANVRAIAWQEDEGAPIAAANLHFLLERLDE